MADPLTKLTIEPTPVSQRGPALRLLRLGHARIQRLLGAAQVGQIDMRGLFYARRGDQLVGASWGQIVPGRTAFCWPPCISPREPEATATQLQQAVDQYLNEEQIVLSQAILPLSDLTGAVRLTRAGYRHLTDLNYLVSERPTFPADPPLTSLEFCSSDSVDRDRWKQLIEWTYGGTLDCSDLEGVRQIEDVLSGYEQTGTFAPHWWVVARYENEDVGCLALADHPEHHQVELMYMGLVPEHRGRGWGHELVRYAQWLAGRSRRQRMVLAVDDTNWPAQSIYERCGFQIWDQRSVFIRTAQTLPPHHPDPNPW